MSTERTRTARIEVRLTLESLVVIRRAAELQGRSPSDFVVTAAQETARRHAGFSSPSRQEGRDAERSASDFRGKRASMYSVTSVVKLCI
jgi:hypothetical protein